MKTRDSFPWRGKEKCHCWLGSSCTFILPNVMHMSCWFSVWFCNIRSRREYLIMPHEGYKVEVERGGKVNMLPTYRFGSWEEVRLKEVQRKCQPRDPARTWNKECEDVTGTIVCTVWYWWGMMMLGYGSSACPDIRLWLQGQIPHYSRLEIHPLRFHSALPLSHLETKAWWTPCPE